MSLVAFYFQPDTGPKDILIGTAACSAFAAIVAWSLVQRSTAEEERLLAARAVLTRLAALDPAKRVSVQGRHANTMLNLPLDCGSFRSPSVWRL
jgi:hypothetical protein